MTRRTIDLDTIDLVADMLYAHAVQHYNDNFGWSIVVECWSHDDICDLLFKHNADTLDKAIAAFADLVDVWDDRYADAVNSQF